MHNFQHSYHPGVFMSEEEYHQMERASPDRRYEYLNGKTRLVSGGSIEHSRIARNIANAIEQHMPHRSCVVSMCGVKMLIKEMPDGTQHFAYPDVAVSCDAIDMHRGTTLIRSPRVVMEVMSPATEMVDRYEKFALYQACEAIQDIVLINQFAERVEVHHREKDDPQIWKRAMYDPGQIVYLTSIDVQLTMNEIYRNIDFDEPLFESN